MLLDVLLPLALHGCLTYELPPSLADRVRVGSRVVVPLGKRKLYTAIVVRLPGTPPAEGVKLKSVLDVVDEAPLLLPDQLRLWHWMADYYLCTEGEVMKAALPSGLKLESETAVLRVADFESDEPLPTRENHVLNLLSTEKAYSIDLLLKRAGGATGTLAALRRLIECGAVTVEENLARTYRPRTATFLRLAPKHQNETALHFLFDSLRRAPRRLEVVQALLDDEGRPLERLARAALLKAHPGCETAILALRKAGVVEAEEVEVGRLAGAGTSAVADASTAEGASSAVNTAASPLSEAQQTAYDSIVQSFKEKPVCLLHGVTSSGKTEIYIRLIEEALARGEQVLYLVPEIALTTQLTDRLARVFGDRMGVYHSKFPDAERVELWQRQLTDRAFPLILGVRSSLFLPFRRLGLVIVDEEHETSYKQQDPAPRYNARDVAIVLAHNCGAHVLLGTATPAVETFYNATVAQKYAYVPLTTRFGGVRLPHIEVENVKELRRKKLMKTPFSPRLIEETRRVLAEGGQAIFFHNRRGYAPVLECHTCGWTPHCRACDVPLTYHRSVGRLVCHYCGATYDVPPRCPNCEETNLRDVGCGTEKIEEAVASVFPEARVARMDLDTTRSRSAYERIIADFQAGKTNLLIGTQMVTKGLDFDGVRVVGILNADQLLNRPDFRAHERAFSMMTQVAGRAGRRDEQGLVILQTRQPELPVVEEVVRSDYAALFRNEIEERELFRFPPFFRLIYINLRHRDEAVCQAAAHAMADLLRPHFGDDLLGPDRPSVGRVQYFHLRRLLLKVRPDLPTAGVRRTLRAAREALLATTRFSSLSVNFDVDPL